MQVSRRDFLRLTASGGAGTAIGGLVGLGELRAPMRAQLGYVEPDLAQLAHHEDLEMLGGQVGQGIHSFETLEH